VLAAVELWTFCAVGTETRRAMGEKAILPLPSVGEGWGEGVLAAVCCY